MGEPSKIATLKGILDPCDDPTQGSPVVVSDLLTEWNGECEQLFANNSQHHEVVDVETLRKISGRVLSILALILISGRNLADALCFNEEASTSDESDNLLSCNETATGSADVFMITDAVLFVRTSKNFLRCYLQFVEPFLVEPSAPSEGTDQSSLMLQRWRSRPLLDRLFSVSFESYTTESYLSQYALQLFFYATYSPPYMSNSALEDTYTYFMRDRALFSRCLEILIAANGENATVLKLAVFRNIHNALVAFPETAPTFLNKAKVPLDDEGNIFSSSSSEPKTEATFREILISTISDQMGESEISRTLDGQQEIAMVEEGLRICYALQLGRSLPQDTQLLTLMGRIFHLDHAQPNCARIQESALTVLVDSNPTTAAFFVQEHLDQQLHAILETRLAYALKSTSTNNQSAATLTPVLVVLYKYCGANTTFRARMHDFVFPPSTREAYNIRVDAEKKRHRGRAKNMAPLDAPMGTLRSNLIEMLTWPESHIKRFVGELLWLLCEQDPQVFTYRVGIGNGLPVLSLKGFASLPSA